MVLVLISVNAVVRLLKRSMCVRGRTHSVVCLTIVIIINE